MVMTRNQKKLNNNSSNISHNTSNVSNHSHNYNTRSKKNISESIVNEPSCTSDNVSDKLKEHTFNIVNKCIEFNKEDAKEALNKDVSNKEDICDTKKQKKKNKNVKKIPSNGMNTMNGMNTINGMNTLNGMNTKNSSGLVPMTLPFSFMLFNVTPNKKMQKIKKNESCVICGDCDCDCEKMMYKNSDDVDINSYAKNEKEVNEDEDDEDEDEDDDNIYEDDVCEECGEEECDCDELDEFFDYMEKIKTLKNKIPEMNIKQEQKDKLLSMLKSGNLDDKRLEWFDTLTKIPFGNYTKYDVNIEDMDNTKEYIKNIYSNLNNSVWGMYDVKEEILNYVTQCIIQPDSKPRVLALCGQPGIGKTKIVRDGISKSLNREMRCFSMGGIKDSSTFLGFDYTYVGSKYGAIVQALIDCKTMNPILFFDELDKISHTKEGMDIENLLIHLTDPVQNHDFHDKYFSGIPIDISKSLLIFSFNDMDSISPILRDRLHIINIPSPSVKDKINIASKYFVKEYLLNFNLKEDEVTFDNDVLKYIIERYTNDESGVRRLKRCIETICMKINTSKLLGTFVKELNLSTSKLNIQLPITLTKQHIDVLLHVKDHKSDKIPFMYT